MLPCQIAVLGLDSECYARARFQVIDLRHQPQGIHQSIGILLGFIEEIHDLRPIGVRKENCSAVGHSTMWLTSSLCDAKPSREIAKVLSIMDIQQCAIDETMQH